MVPSVAMPSGHLVVPSKGKAVAALLWLHGFGDGPDEWAKEFRQLLHVRHPGLHGVYMRAPRLPQKCFNGATVSSWGDYHDQNATRKGTPDYDNQAIVSDEVLSEAESVLNDLVKRVGVPPSQVVVGGFSMGATAAAEIALRYGRNEGPLGGLIMLNGWLLPGARGTLGSVVDPSSNVVPQAVLVSHGSADEQVGFDIGTEAAELLHAASARAGGSTKVSFEVQKGMKHCESGFGQGKAHAVSFLDALCKNAAC